jgi:hypothetical protein
MPNQPLNMPPFPPLTRDKYSWTGEVELPSWAGFQSRRGAYGSFSSHAKSDGRAHLTIEPQTDDAETPPTPEQVRAFQLLVDNEPAVANSVLLAIFTNYPDMRDKYGYRDEDAAELMPEIQRADQLRQLIGLSSVHVLSVAKDATVYIGFEFGCTWDVEHGLGVMTHKDRVVKVGGADTSFLEWIAERDAKNKK